MRGRAPTPSVSQNACDWYHLNSLPGYYRLQIRSRPLGQSKTLRDQETRDWDKTETKDCRGRDKTKTTKKWSTSLTTLLPCNCSFTKDRQYLLLQYHSRVAKSYSRQIAVLITSTIYVKCNTFKPIYTCDLKCKQVHSIAQYSVWHDNHMKNSNVFFYWNYICLLWAKWNKLFFYQMFRDCIY